MKYNKFEGHTPGPWRKFGTCLIIAEDDCEIGSCHTARTLDKNCANANLAAAAPDLLAACKRKDELLEDVLHYIKTWGTIKEPLLGKIKNELSREDV